MTAESPLPSNAGAAALASKAIEHGEPMVVVDQNWHILTTNRRFEALAGVAREHMIGGPVWAILGGSERSYQREWERMQREWERMLDEQRPAFVEYYFPSQTRWLDISIYPCDGVISLFFRDVTEKKGIQQALLNNALDAVVGMDVEGRVIDWNAQAEAVFGWSREEALGRLMSELIIPMAQREMHERGLKHYLASGHDAILNQRIEVLALSRDGAEFPVELTVTPLATGNGVNFYAFVRDISDQKRIERERQETLERLERNLTLNETFVAVLAHDLRTPLSAIHMNSVLLERLSEAPNVLRASGQIASSARRMGRMIEQLLDVSRARIGGGIPIDPQPIDMESICRDAISEVMMASGCVIDFLVDGDCKGTWDPDRMAQVMSNLVGNAVQHSIAGSGVKVRLDGRATNSIELSITNGGDIPAEVVPLLFEPFEHFSQGQRGRSGLGLGLYIAREIVSGHGGTITFESPRQPGITTFVIRLPRRSAAEYHKSTSSA